MSSAIRGRQMPHRPAPAHSSEGSLRRIAATERLVSCDAAGKSRPLRAPTFTRWQVVKSRNGREHFGSVSTRVDARIGLLDPPILVNDVSHAVREFHQQKVRHRNVVHAAKCSVGVDKKIEWQAFVLPKTPLRGGGIEAHAEDHCSLVSELLRQLAEPARLNCSTRCTRLRKEVEHDVRLSQKVVQPDLPAVLVLRTEPWRLLTRLEHQCASLPERYHLSYPCATIHHS